MAAGRKPQGVAPWAFPMAYYPANPTEPSIESIRERQAASALPPINWLHVWWARRPLSISRAAVAAALLSGDADRQAFYDAIGTYPEIIENQQSIDAAKLKGKRLKGAVYVNPKRPHRNGNHPRAFEHNLTPQQRQWFRDNLAGDTPDAPTVLDVTAGGGSIPFEAGRLGLPTIANELNPVAAIILHATCRWPQQFGRALPPEYQAVSQRFRRRVAQLLAGAYPAVPPLTPPFPENPQFQKNRIVRAQRYVWGYLWARTIKCYECDREIPLSPNWRLSSKGDGVRLWPDETAGRCRFQIVTKASEQSPGTVQKGIARCPYPDCRAASPKGYLAQQAQAGQMGHRLYCVIYRDQYWPQTKSGHTRKKPITIRTFAPARPEDDNLTDIAARLAQLQPQWDAHGILPDETLTRGNKTDTPIDYGMPAWSRMFNYRQQLAHGYCVQAFRELVDEDAAAGALNDLRKAAWCYVALALDKLISVNNLLCRWHPNRNVVAGIFDSRDFGFRWAYAEMAVTIEGLGLDWAIDDIGECIDDLTVMTGYPAVTASVPGDARLELNGGDAPPAAAPAAPSEIACGPAQDLDLPSGSIDAIIFDPPYHANVNFAELSDFFYVWLKRTVGRLHPELCRPHQSDKVNEAIASPARFRAAAAAGGPSAAVRATADYEAKMAQIFRECRRVIKADGIMTVMFTHKSTAAWDALITGLIGAGFRITRTWPVKTEPETSLSIRGKAAARTTVLLVCRPQPANRPPPAPWDEVEHRIAQAVRADVPILDGYGLKPTDLYLAAFGPALQVISDHWGSQRASAHPDPARAENPFAVTPTDAMQVARQEVSRHRAAQLSRRFANVADPAARFYILSADSSGGDTLEYDDAALMARVAGLEPDSREGRSLMVKKGQRVTLKSAAERQAAGDLGRDRAPSNPLDQVHTAVAVTIAQDTVAAEEWLRMQAIDLNGDAFQGTLQALYRALKPGHDDRIPLGNLHQRLYGQEPPQQGEMPL